jgi:hypothetical protein
MDRPKFMEKLKTLAQDRKKVAGVVLVLAALAGGGVYFGARGKHAALGHATAQHPHGEKQAKHDAGHGKDGEEGEGHETSAEVVATHEIPSLWRIVYEAVVSTNEKLDAMQTAERDAERLRNENAFLRTRVESMRFDCHAKDASSLTQRYEYKLNEETGSRVARTLANIPYRVPVHLLPNQVHTQGVSYFKAHEDEKAAVIFTFLTGLEDNADFKTARNFLMTGVSWYRLDNYELADSYFDEVLKQKESRETQQPMAQARLWKGLVAEKLGKHSSSQTWLTELVDHHPRSVEARWVNSEARRGVASEE